MAVITYQDKSYLNENADIPEVNKITAANMNEIKSTINTNDGAYRALINKYRNSITAQPSTNATLSTTNPTQVQLDTSIVQGSFLSLDNNAVVIPSGVSKVKVSANILFLTGGVGSSSRRGIEIQKNGTQYVYINIPSSETYTGCSITPILMSVQENDTISLVARNQGTTGSVISAANTYLTVEVVD